LKLRDLAERLGCRLEGDGELDIRRVAGIDEAGPGDLTFLANPKYARRLASTRASAVILGRPSDGEAAAPPPFAVLRSENPYLSFAKALALLNPPSPLRRGVDPLASVAPDATLGPDVSIGPFVAIGAGAVVGARSVVHAHAVIAADARVGEDCVIHSHVSIRERVVVGHRVIVQNGAVIGSDGFGFVRLPDGTHFKIPQEASVVLEDDVEIGANTTIDRPAVGETRIRAGAKIDNLVQIAHGVTVGARALFAAQVGIAGSTIVEDDVVLAGQVGVGGHLRLGKGAMATGQTGITNSLDPGAFVSGCPAIPNRDFLRSSAIFGQLPELKKRVAALEERLAELAAKMKDNQSS